MTLLRFRPVIALKPRFLFGSCSIVYCIAIRGFPYDAHDDSRQNKIFIYAFCRPLRTLVLSILGTYPGVRNGPLIPCRTLPGHRTTRRLNWLRLLLSLLLVTTADQKYYPSRGLVWTDAHFSFTI